MSSTSMGLEEEEEVMGLRKAQRRSFLGRRSTQRSWRDTKRQRDSTSPLCSNMEDHHLHHRLVEEEEAVVEEDQKQHHQCVPSNSCVECGVELCVKVSLTLGKAR
jgi:hypothetical protein